MTLDGKDKIAILSALVLTIFIYTKKQKRASLPYPPGPQKLPLLGNILDIPSSFQWVAFDRWSKACDSDIIHLSAAGSDIIVLNTIEAANELLDKRSSIYSSRPTFTMMNELMGWDWAISNMPYGDPWREHRRLFTKHFHPSNARNYAGAQVEFVRKMLTQLLENPQDFFDITRETMAGMALTLAYGLPIQKHNDPYIRIAEDALHTVSVAATPGAFFVDVIPILKYVPDWVPGAGFQKVAKNFNRLQEMFTRVPFEDTIKNLATGIARPSFVSTCLDEIEGSSDESHEMDVIRYTAAMVFAAGSDTTLSSLRTFFLAMVRYPEVQARAQEELDKVLRGRLPELSDEPDLPYISAMVKEITRWQPVTPMAIPHYASEDDEYKGYRIPKGATVIANSWAMLYDEKVYADPADFKPERFLTADGKLNPNVRDPSLVAFGFGRRICPGSHIGLSTMWLTIATVLSTLNISKAVDKNGMPTEPSMKYLSGVVHCPAPFKCTIEPRSSSAEDTILSISSSKWA